jgi:hypothetical protein
MMTRDRNEQMSFTFDYKPDSIVLNSWKQNAGDQQELLGTCTINITNLWEVSTIPPNSSGSGNNNAQQANKGQRLPLWQWAQLETKMPDSSMQVTGYLQVCVCVCV